MKRRSAARIVLLGVLITGLWWFSAAPLYAQTALQDPACTATQKNFFVRMRCLFNIATDAVGSVIKGRTTQVPATAPGVEPIPVDRLLPTSFASQAGPQTGGYDQGQSLLIGPDGEKIFLGVGAGNQFTIPPSFKDRYQAVKTSGYIIEYKEKPVIEYKEELEQKLSLSPSLSVKDRDGSLSLNQTGEAQLKSQLRDYDQKIEREHTALENSIATKLSISKSELENKTIGEFKNTFNGIALNITAEEIDKVRQLPGVKGIHPNFEVKILLSESVPLIGADKVWKLDKDNGQCAQSGKECLTGKGVKIGIVDTGVDYTHPDLGGCTTQQFTNKQCTKVVGGYDFVNNDSDPMDDQGHGTHVAATAAGNGVLKGVAPDVLIYAIKVLDSGGSGWVNQIISGIEWSVDPNGDGDFSDRLGVINLSLGGWGDPDDPMSQAIDRAVDAGVVAVIAAGNSGPWGGSIASPGTARKAITVAASDKTGKIADFSSRGPVKWEDSNENISFLLKPDITAPGVSICAAQSSQDKLWQLIKDYRGIDTHCLDDKHIAINGTSMATPHVAGLVALLKQKDPLAEPAQIKSALKNSAVDLGFGWFDQGAGRINALKSSAQSYLIASLSGPELGSGLVAFRGTVTSRSPFRYLLYYGSGLNPGESDWIKFKDGDFPSLVSNIVLGNLDTRNLNDGLYTVKLVVVNGDGKAEDKMRLTVDNVRIDIRNYEEFSNTSLLIISGNAEREGFGHYELWANDVYSNAAPPFLMKESKAQIHNNVLGNLYLGRDELKNGGLFRISLQVFDPQNRIIDSESKIIYVESSLRGGWPRRLDSYGTHSSFNAFDVDGNKDLELFFGNDFYDQPNATKPNFQGFTHNGASVPGWPVGFKLRGGTYSSPAIADINKDGKLEIAVLTQSNSELFVFDSAGKVLFTHGLTGGGGGSESHPSIADLNQDGYDDIIYPTITEVDLENKKARSQINAVNYKGENLPGFPKEFDGWIYGQAIGDVNNDGFPDVVFPASTFKNFIPGSSLVIYILSGQDGALLKRVPLKGESAYAPVLGDVDGDGELNIVIAVEDYNQPENKGVYVLDADGNVLPGWPRDVSVQGHYYTDIPSIADIDADGKLEILFADWIGGVHIWRADGSDMGGWPRYGFGVYQFTQPIVADIDGDGGADIITQGSHIGSFSSSEGPNLVFAFKKDGSLIAGFPKQTLRRSCRVNGGAPLVADIDNDGLLELVSHSQDDIFCSGKEGNNLFVKVWDLKGKASADGVEWPMFMHDNQNTGLYRSVLKPLDTPRNLSASLVFPASPSNTTSTATTSRLLVKLAWEDTSAEEDGFEVWRSENAPGEERFFKKVPANTEVFLDDEVKGGVTYHYRVRAFRIDDECVFSIWKIRIGCRDRHEYSDFSAPVSIGVISGIERIISGDEVSVPRAGFERADVGTNSGSAAPAPVPARITPDAFIFKVPRDAPPAYHIDTSLVEGAVRTIKRFLIEER